MATDQALMSADEITAHNKWANEAGSTDGYERWTACVECRIVHDPEDESCPLNQVADDA